MDDLRRLVERELENGSRINEELRGRYWYPLSTATYGVDEVMQALDSMCSFRTTMWEKTRRFEDAFGERFGGEAVMVNSGSSADLLIAFALLEESGGALRAGDEVIVPAVTWPTQLWSVLMAGFSVRLADVDPLTLNIDFDSLANVVSEKTRALSLVHLMGNPVDMDRALDFCREHDLVLIEDCCESLGATWGGVPVGTFGEASSFSFFFSHHMTTMEGGMILTTNSELAERFRLLRAHGWSRNLRDTFVPPPGLDPRYTFVSWGFNVRPTELQAGFGLVQLERLDMFDQYRRANSDAFRRIMEPISGDVRLMEVLPRGACSWFALPMMVTDRCQFSRDEFVKHLEDNGVETRPIVAGNLLHHPAVSAFPKITNGPLPGADSIHRNGFYVGLHPTDDQEAAERVGNLIVEFVHGK